jgi:glutaredoxin
MIKVTLISPSGCQHCGQVKGALEKLKTDYPDLAIEEVEATTLEGQELIIKYGILSSPGILINDEFFAMGGASEKQLRERFSVL